MMEQKAYYSILSNLASLEARNIVKIVQSTRSVADEKCVQQTMKFKCDPSDRETTLQAKEKSYNVQKVYRQSPCQPLAKPLLCALHLALAPTAPQGPPEQEGSLISLTWVFHGIKKRKREKRLKVKISTNIVRLLTL